MARTLTRMIDYFALALGHGLLAIVMLRLVLRDGLDADPLITRIKDETASARQAVSTSGRNAARRARAGGAGAADADEDGPSKDGPNIDGPTT